MEQQQSYEIQGQAVKLPAAIRDASSGTAIYTVEIELARKLVPDAFELVEVEPGKTHLVLVIVDYRDNDLGDYDEVGITFFVKPAGQPDAEAGSYIYKLPVNQSFTCEAGAKIWGFPKTVEEIDFTYKDDSATCKLTMGGQHVLTLSVPRGGDGVTPEAKATGYTLIDGVPHCNEFLRGGSGEQAIVGGEGVFLELGEHEISSELKSLGLETAEPILSAWTEKMVGSFGGSKKI